MDADEGNMKINLRDMGCTCVAWIQRLSLSTTAGSGNHGNENSGFVTAKNFFNQLTTVSFLKRILLHDIILINWKWVSTRWQRSLKFYTNRKVTAMYMWRNNAQNTTKPQNTQNKNQNIYKKKENKHETNNNKWKTSI